MKYPEYAKELAKLLSLDQADKKDFARQYFTIDDQNQLKAERQVMNIKTEKRIIRMLEILEEIGEPSLSNLGSDGALALSVLASHGAPVALNRVLVMFEKLYERDKEDCRYQSIPAMVDASRLAKRQSQRFATQWFFDKDKYPFLPTVDDFEHVNERRRKYGIEPLRWPKSLAIPESAQSWLSKPLDELIMREPTPGEYKSNLNWQ